jgi:hypothetical protein
VLLWWYRWWIWNRFTRRKSRWRLGSIFDPQKAEAATLDPSQQVSGQNAVTGSGQPLDQTDLQTTNLKYQSEVRRANNIDYEKEKY